MASDTQQQAREILRAADERGWPTKHEQVLAAILAERDALAARVEQMRAALELSREYVVNASQRYYHGIRAEAERRLALIDAALAGPAPAPAAQPAQAEPIPPTTTEARDAEAFLRELPMPEAVAKLYSGNGGKFGRSTILKCWLPAAETLPDGEHTVFTAEQLLADRRAVFAAGMEAAARVCEERARHHDRRRADAGAAFAADQCADAIRAAKP